MTFSVLMVLDISLLVDIVGVECIECFGDGVEGEILGGRDRQTIFCGGGGVFLEAVGVDAELFETAIQLHRI
jgi:hypothetical protein